MPRIVADEAVRALDVSGNTLYAAGDFTKIGPATNGALHVNSTGSPAPGTWPFFDGDVNVIIPDGAGGWYVGGSFRRVDDIDVPLVARVTAGGELDASFHIDAPLANDTRSEALALELDGSGKLYVGGWISPSFSPQNVGLLVADAATGTVNLTAMQSRNTNGAVRALQHVGSKLWIGGEFAKYAGAPSPPLIAVDDVTYDVQHQVPVSGVKPVVQGIVVHGNQLYVGGSFASVTIGGVQRPVENLFSMDTDATAIGALQGADGAVAAISDDGDALLVGGSFSMVNGIATGSLAVVTDGGSTVRGTALASHVRSISTHNGLTRVATASTVYSLAQNAGTPTLDPQFPMSTLGVGTTAPSAVVATSGGGSIVAGAWHLARASARPGIAALDIASGSVSNAFAPSSPVFDAGVRDITSLRVAGDRLWVGGSFALAGGGANLAAFDARTGARSTIVSTPTAAVNAISAYADDSVLIGGAFTGWGGQTHLARLTSFGTWHASQPSAPGGIVHVIERTGPESALVGGQFVGGLLRLVGSGASSDPAFAASTRAGDWVKAIALDPRRPDEALIGGRFETYQGEYRGSIARIDARTGSLVRTFNADVSTADRAFEGAPAPDVDAIVPIGATALVGGTFTAYRGRAAAGFVAVNTTSGDTSAWSTGPITRLRTRALAPDLLLVGSAAGVSAYTVDTTPPPAPPSVRDGMTAVQDVNLIVDEFGASANWDTPAQPDDVSGYEACISISPDACVDNVWRSVTTTQIAWTTHALVEGTTYYTLVRSVDAAGNVSPIAASNGVTYVAEPVKPIDLAEVVAGDVDLRGQIDVPPLVGSGLVTITATKRGGSSKNACEAMPDASGTWTCVWHTNPAFVDGTYDLDAKLLSLIPSRIASGVVVDNTKPQGQLTLVSGTATRVDSTDPRKVWFRPVIDSQFDVQVEATDSGSGIATVTSTGHDAAWAVGHGLRTLPWAGQSVTMSFAPGPAAGATGTVAIGVLDRASNSWSSTITAMRDDTPPAGFTAVTAGGDVDVPSIEVMVGTDAGAGVRGYDVQRRTMPRIDGRCETGAAGTWETFASEQDPTPGPRTFVDHGAPRDVCVDYRVVAVDYVGNASYTDAQNRSYTVPTAIIPSIGNLAVKEGSAAATYELRLTRTPTGPVTLALASSAPDQLAITPANVTFGAGQTTRTITVAALDDAYADGDRSVMIEHRVTSGPAPFDAIPSFIVSVDVTDDDVAGVRLGGGAVLQLDEADPTGASIGVSLASKPRAPVTIHLTGDPSVLVSPPSVRIEPDAWTNPVSVQVTPVDDRRAQGRHAASISARVESSDPAYHGRSVAAQAVSIADDDVADLELVAPANVLLAEASSEGVTYRVRLTAQPNAPVDVRFTDSSGQASARPDQLTFTPANWDAYQLITFAAIQDDIAEPSPHTATMNVAVITTDPAFRARDGRRLSFDITDDDVAALVVTPGEAWTRDGAQLTMPGDPSIARTFTIQPRTAPVAPVTINAHTPDTSRIALAPAQQVIPARSTAPVMFTVTVKDGAGDASFESLVAWSIASPDPMYAAVRLPDTSFAVRAPTEAPPVDREPRTQRPTEPAPRTPTDQQPRLTDTPPADDPSASTGDDAAGATDTQPAPTTTSSDPHGIRDDAHVESRTDDERREAPPRGPREHERTSHASGGVAAAARRVGAWARENTAAAVGAGAAGAVAAAGVASKLAAAKGLTGMFGGHLPSPDQLGDGHRYIRPRRVRNGKQKARSLRDKLRRRRLPRDRGVEPARRRRRAAPDPVREILDRAEGRYPEHDALRALERGAAPSRPDILDELRPSADAGFELDLDAFDGDAAA